VRDPAHREVRLTEQRTTGAPEEVPA